MVAQTEFFIANKKLSDWLPVFVTVFVRMVICIGVTSSVIYGVYYFMMHEFNFDRWLIAFFSIVCVSALLIPAQCFALRHLVPMSFSPALRASVFWVSMWIANFVGSESSITMPMGLGLFVLLYMSQLWVDKIEVLCGGYVLLFNKLWQRIARETKIRNVPKAKFGNDSRILVVDTSEWFEFSDMQMNAIAEQFPSHSLVNSFGSLRAEDYSKIDVIFGAPPKRLLNLMTALRWLHIPSAGFNGYDRMSLYSSSPRITTSSGVYGVPIGEYTLSLMLMMSKGIYSASLNNKCGYGNDIRHSLGDFQGSTVLLVGLGDIGQAIAKSCDLLQAKVIGIRRNVSQPVPHVSELYRLDQLEEVVQLADFVVLCLPGAPETDNIIDREIMKQMRPTAVLINVGRGNAVNQSDLRRALRKKEIAAAALDVTVPEPLLPFSRLFRYRDLVCTLHHSSISKTNNQRAMDLFLRRAVDLIPRSHH